MREGVKKEIILIEKGDYGFSLWLEIGGFQLVCMRIVVVDLGYNLLYLKMTHYIHFDLRVKTLAIGNNSRKDAIQANSSLQDSLLPFHGSIISKDAFPTS